MPPRRPSSLLFSPWRHCGSSQFAPIATRLVRIVHRWHVIQSPNHAPKTSHADKDTIEWTHFLPQTSSQSSLLIVTDPNEPGKIASGVTFLQSLDKFGAGWYLCKQSVSWPPYISVGTYLIVYQGYQGRRALCTCRWDWTRTDECEWRLDCKSRWMKKQWNSFGGERNTTRRWRNKKGWLFRRLFRMFTSSHSLTCMAFSGFFES